MRIGLLIIAILALVAFIVVAVVLPQRSQSGAKDAAQALLSGAEPAKKQVEAAAEKGGVATAGKGVKIAEQSDAKHGKLKWIVSENGAIRGWNEENAIEITMTPALAGGKVTWTCRGYPVGAMPASCAGR